MRTNWILALALSWSSAAAAERVTADDILEQALRTARANENDPVESRYAYRMRTETRRLGGDGEVDSREHRVWRVQPKGGVSYRRLVEKNGEARTAPPERMKAEADDAVRFDETLVARFVTRLVGCVDVSGRPTYRIDFHPTDPPAAERSRVDAILNRVRGSVWFDAASFEIRRVEFELIEGARVALGPTVLGWLGRLRELSGTFERAPAEDGAWLPHHLDVRFRGRALFRTFHVEEITRWDRYSVQRTGGTPKSSRSTFSEVAR